MSVEKDKVGGKGAAISERLTVEAELLDTGMPAPRAGFMYIISIMRYEVLRVVRGKYPYPFIYIGHDAPDLQSQQFQVGAHHRLKLQRAFPKGSSILNKFQDENLEAGLFFCTSFEVIR